MILVGIKNKWSEESVKKIIDMSKQINIPKLLVEFAILVQVSKIFYKSTYALEGNNILVLLIR